MKISEIATKLSDISYRAIEIWNMLSGKNPSGLSSPAHSLTQDTSRITPCA